MWKPVEDIGHLEIGDNDDFWSGSPRADDRLLVPFVQFRGDSHMVYYQSPFGKSILNKGKQQQIMLKAREKRYTGEMSDGAVKRMKKALSLLIQATRPRWMDNPVTGRKMLHTVSVCTLTIGSGLDPIISIDKAKELLEDFLQWLYHTKGVRLRVWKVELQKRGQPHFHLVFPDFIHYQEIRAKWNDIQRKHRTIDGWATKHKNFDPPSTEIKKAYQKGDIVAYLTKELSKETHAVKVQYWQDVRKEFAAGELVFDDVDVTDKRELKKAFKNEVNRRFEMEFHGVVEAGKIWDCSEVLSQTKYFTLALSTRQEAFFNECLVNSLCERKEGEEGWWYTIKWYDKPPPGFFSEKQDTEYKEFLKVIVDKANGIDPPEEEKPKMRFAANYATGTYEWMPIEEPKPVVVEQPAVLQTEILFNYEDGAKLFIDSGSAN